MKSAKVILFLSVLIMTFPAFAEDYGDACLREIFKDKLMGSPGGNFGLLTNGTINGYGYSIDITRAPGYDDKEMLREKIKRLQEEIETTKRKLEQ